MVPQFAPSSSLAHDLQQQVQVLLEVQRVRVAVAQRLPARLQRLLEQRPRLLQLAHLLQQHAHSTVSYPMWAKEIPAT